MPSSFTPTRLPEEEAHNGNATVTPQANITSKAMDGYSLPSTRDVYIFTSLFTAAEVIGVICIILVSILTANYLGGFAWTDDPGKEFNFHPLFMIIGMIFFYGNAILIYRVLRSMRKVTLKLMHVALHTMAFILTVVALQAVFDSHNLIANPIPNMYSLHSWIGLSTVILFSMQFVAGFSAFLFPGISRGLRIRYLVTHVYFGVLIFVMAVAACVTGLTEKMLFSHQFDYAHLQAPSVLVNCLGLLLIVFAGLVVYLVTSSKYKRQPLPEEAILPLEPHSPLN